MLLVSIAKIQKIILIRNNIQKKYHFSHQAQGEKEGVPISLDTPSWLWYYFCSTIYFSSLTAVFLAADFLAAGFSAFSSFGFATFSAFDFAVFSTCAFSYSSAACSFSSFALSRSIVLSLLSISSPWFLMVVSRALSSSLSISSGYRLFTLLMKSPSTFI